ncbi:MAG: hypothetical protein A2204_06455, partial [Elusimicrobia bacterium RIFOXYA1_FULL_47_7]
MKKIILLSFAVVALSFNSVVGITSPDFASMPDDDILNTIERAAFDYFWNGINNDIYGDSSTVKNKWNNYVIDYPQSYSPTDTGFALVAACIGHKRGWISEAEAIDRINVILTKYQQAPESAAASHNELVHHNGFFYRTTTSTGTRYDTSTELATIDTTFLAAGVLFAGKYCVDNNLTNGTTIWNNADYIYNRINWNWMRRDSTNDFINWSWTPESGFDLTSNIGGFSEGVLSYVLAMGSTNYSLNNLSGTLPLGWKNLGRATTSYQNITYVPDGWGALFCHQYPDLFVDFTGKRDGYQCYAADTYKATISHHRYAYNNSSRYATYGKNSWGLGEAYNPSAINGGYYHFGINAGRIEDGTVALSNLICAINQQPRQVIDSIKYLIGKYPNTTGNTNHFWGLYGFPDSYNIDTTGSFNEPDLWRGDDVVGVHQGAILVAIENYRSGLVKNTFSNISYIQKALITGAANLGFTADTTAPGKITVSKIANLSADKSKVGRIALNWAAPGDNDYTLNLSSGMFEVRFATIASDTWDSAPPNYLYYNTVFDTQAVAGSAQSWVVTGLADAPYYYFWVRATDDSFNWSAVSDKLTVSMSNALAASPSSGYNTYSPGTVTLTGFEFGAGTTVKLVKSGESDIAASSVSITDGNTLTCVFDTAGKASGNWDIVVTTGGANSSFTYSAGFTVKTMAMTSAAPASAVSNSGVVTVELTGEGFVAGSTVKLVKAGQAEVTAANVTVTSSNKISFSVDTSGMAAGAWDIVVSTTIGTSAVTMTFASAFEISGYPTSSKNLVEKAKNVTVVLKAEKGDITIDVPAGSFSQDVYLTVIVSTVPVSLRDTFVLTELGIELLLDKNIQPEKEIIITVKYRDADARGFDESQFVIARYDEGRLCWLPLVSTAYPSENKVEGKTNHFSRFAILQFVPASDVSGVKV